MASLSVCMIVKNEEEVLGRCLECVQKLADEIIVVDTGSTDQTKTIAAWYTPYVYDFPWIDDFSVARNYSFSLATQEFIMWIDADDVLTDGNIERLLELKKQLDASVDVVMLKYDMGFDENGNPTFSFYRERIFRREWNPQWVGEVHETVTPFGNILYQDISVEHRKEKTNEPERNLRIYETMLMQGKVFDARQQFYYARELYYNGRYEQAIAMFEQFLLQDDAWIENKINACKDTAACCFALRRVEEGLKALFKSFLYDRPRAEICCDIANCFFQKEEYKTAIFWYETAASIPMNLESGAFVLRDCYGFIPYLQLCVCYDRIGEQNRASEYNELAGRLKPNDPSYLHNKQYFEAVQAEKATV